MVGRDFGRGSSKLELISAAVAMTDAGYENSYNILEGFEGDKDEKSQRGTVGGWKLSGLPWQQS